MKQLITRISLLAVLAAFTALTGCISVDEEDDPDHISTTTHRTSVSTPASATVERTTVY